MITFTDITARLRNFYDSRFEPEGIRPLAEMYWRTLMLIASLLCLAALLFGIWNLFSVFDTLSSLADTSPPPPAAFSSSALHALSGGFDARQTQFNTFTSNPPSAAPDPSK